MLSSISFARSSLRGFPFRGMVNKADRARTRERVPAPRSSVTSYGIPQISSCSNRERACVRSRSVGRAFDSKAEDLRGVYSRDKTNTHGLKITENRRYLDCPANG